MSNGRKEFEERLHIILDSFQECPSFIIIPKNQRDTIIEQILESLDYFDIYEDNLGDYSKGGNF